MINLDTEIIELNRVGKATAKKLERLGVNTAKNLLFYFPFRYEDYSELTPIRELQSGINANIVGRIELIQNKRSSRKKMYITEALISDETESIKVVWFNQPFLIKNLRAGDLVSLAGKVEGDLLGLTMVSPNYEKLGGNMTAVHTQGLVPIYHLTENITQKQIRFLIKSVIEASSFIEDWLPLETKKRQGLINLGEAIKKIHFPKSKDDFAKARKRLAFDELFILQIRSQLLRKELNTSQAEKIEFKEKETKKFVDSLPFKLTNDQRKAAWEILQDINKERPMARLLEGDVGSGKTIVAAIAMLNAALNNKQAVLMVPTEILARQHYETIKKLLGEHIPIALLTRSQFSIFNFQFPNNFQFSNNKISKHHILDNIKNGNVKIIIGTHALLQENVSFNNLALAIIDEQHRFGVAQRAKLAKRTEAFCPHLLSMTATPIPRSLALALYGDLDLSIIKQMPAGRKKIITKIVAEADRAKAYQFIREQIKKGRQAFVICPLIDISDSLGVKSVKQEYEKLAKNIFSDLKIGLLHGKMKSREKEEIMEKFLKNEINILVSTSVVEVGVDVPNAVIMMIEGADRFGLAQLHQFRGRVGREEQQSYCFLFTQLNSRKANLTGLAENDSLNTAKRLDAMTKFNDGFALAREDLKYRGPGEVFGTMQKGFPELKIASLFDYELMKKGKEEAEFILNIDPSLNKWPLLKDKTREKDLNGHLE